MRGRTRDPLLGRCAAAAVVVALMTAAAGCALASDGRGAGGARGAAACGWTGTVRGAPGAAALRRAGLAVWFDGRWHVRVRGGASAHTFTGTVKAAAAIGKPHVAGAERGDRASTGGSTLRFRLRGGRRDVDRVDFRAPCGTLAWDLRRDGVAAPATALRLGARATAAPAARFDADAPARTAVAGQVTLGPTCPVEGAPECTGGAKPVQATVDIDAVSGRRGEPQSTQRVASVPTGADGRFDANLPPGTYMLTARTDSSQAPPEGPAPTYATVVDGLVTDVDVRVDTGLR